MFLFFVLFFGFFSSNNHNNNWSSISLFPKIHSRKIQNINITAYFICYLFLGKKLLVFLLDFQNKLLHFHTLQCYCFFILGCHSSLQGQNVIHHFTFKSSEIWTKLTHTYVMHKLSLKMSSLHSRYMQQYLRLMSQCIFRNFYDFFLWVYFDVEGKNIFENNFCGG